MNAHPHDQVIHAFGRLVHALQHGGLEEYRALVCADVAAQEGLFLHNARKVQDGSLALKLRTIEEQGDVALVHFELLAPAGTSQGEGQVTFTREADGWRIRSL